MLTVEYMENTLYPEEWLDVRLFIIIRKHLIGTA